MTTRSIALTLSTGSRGIVLVPESSGVIDRGVLLIHGWNGDMGETNGLFLHLASALAESGIASVRFNVSGEGERAGYVVSSTVESRRMEAELAWTTLREHCGVKIGGVLGLSLGAFTAMTTAAAHPAWFQSMVLWSGVSDMNGTGNVDYRNALREALQSGRGVYREHREMVLTREFALSYIARDAADHLRDFNGALLSIRCERDYAPHKEREWLSSTPSTDKAALLIGGGSHMFNTREADTEMSPEAERAIEATVSWFSRTLRN